MTNLEDVLCVHVCLVEVDVRKYLTRQVANRDASATLGSLMLVGREQVVVLGATVAARDDGVEYPQELLVGDAPCE